MSNDYQSRLFDEHNQLRSKIDKLKAFIVGEAYDNLSDVDKADLKEQLKHMESYFAVLSRRASRLCGAA